MTKSVLQPRAGARWAIARKCTNGMFVCLIENTPVLHEGEVVAALQTLGLDHTLTVLDQYFPYNRNGQRCPTFALMSLWYDLAPANAADAATKV